MSSYVILKLSCYSVIDVSHQQQIGGYQPTQQQQLNTAQVIGDVGQQVGQSLGAQQLNTNGMMNFISIVMTRTNLCHPIVNFVFPFTKNT